MLASLCGLPDVCVCCAVGQFASKQKEALRVCSSQNFFFFFVDQKVTDTNNSTTCFWHPLKTRPTLESCPPTSTQLEHFLILEKLLRIQSTISVAAQPAGSNADHALTGKKLLFERKSCKILARFWPFNRLFIAL